MACRIPNISRNLSYQLLKENNLEVIMKYRILILVCLILLGFMPAFADVIYVSGPVSGVWSADSVLVIGEVWIPSESTLIIEPGVKVIFWVYCKFIVYNDAVLHAVGTDSDIISFDEHTPGNGWHGIRFINASDSSRIEYCHMQNGFTTGNGEDGKGGAIYCSNCSPTIKNCLIINCSAMYGGGICCDNNSNPSISDNTFTLNSADGGSYSDGGGGGICCNNSSNPTITGNTFNDNSGTGASGFSGGGGLYCLNSNPTISSNIISENTSNHHGGGINCYYSNPTINDNMISYNWAYSGGGIFCFQSNPTVLSNSITENSVSNSSESKGGGIYCLASSPIIFENTISGNTATVNGGGIYCGNWSYNPSNPTVCGNTISGNLAINYNHGCGGGIYCEPNCNLSIELNEISQNTATNYGGCIYIDSAAPSMNKNTIVYNEASIGGGLYCTSSNPVLVNCILWGNDPEQIYQISGSATQISYSDIQEFFPGTGNIYEDPLFVNPENGDYHLTGYSLCIDSGNPDPLYNDPDSTRADMGTYYFDQSGIIYPPLADFIADITEGYAPLTINFTDLSAHGSLIINQWYWNFGDEGSSSIQNPTYEYLNPGIYSVTLTVTDENDSTDTEEKINYITVFGNEQPASPTDVNINISGYNVNITWSPVDTTINGYPTNVDAYLIYNSISPYSDFSFLGLTTDTTYTHQYVAQFSDNVFYQVTSYVGDFRLLQNVITKYPNLRLGEIDFILEKKKLLMERE